MKNNILTIILAIIFAAIVTFQFWQMQILVRQNAELKGQLMGIQVYQVGVQTIQKQQAAQQKQKIQELPNDQ